MRLRARDFNRRITRQIFRYHLCPRCALWFLDPIPADLGRYYPDEYHAFPAVETLRAAAQTVEGYKLEAILPLVGSGRMLEIGPGNGGFALLAQDAGFKVDTIEMDARCCQFLREQIGAYAVQSDDPTAALREMEQKYDVIALWHVIEHLPDGWELLRRATERLQPGGIIALAAPNPDSFSFRVLRARWPHLDAPRHLQLLPIAFLEARARELGLETVMVTTSDGGALGWNDFAWRQALTNLAPTPLFRGRGVLLKILDLAARVLSRLWRGAERGGLRGSTYTLVFQKRNPE